MELWELFMIAVGLSMDAVAVSASNGIAIRGMKWKHALATGLAFGLFQGLMPTIGYFAGSLFTKQISLLDHWIALILLGFIGGRMIYESVKNTDQPEYKQRKLTVTLLFVQAIATSIDALAVGVSFAALQIDILTAALFIAATTFVLSVIAVFIGKRFGDLLNRKAEILGGSILILIGLKIFIEHVFFG